MFYWKIPLSLLLWITPDGLSFSKISFLLLLIFCWFKIWFHRFHFFCHQKKNRLQMSATGGGCAVLYFALVAMEMSHNYYPCLERKKWLKSILGLKIFITIKILTTSHRGSAMWSNLSLLEKGGERKSFLVRQECRGAGDKVGQTTAFCKLSWFLYHQFSVLSLSSTWTEAELRLLPLLPFPSWNISAIWRLSLQVITVRNYLLLSSSLNFFPSFH